MWCNWGERQPSLTFTCKFTLRLSPALNSFSSFSALRNARRWTMMARIRRLWVEENGQDIAEYAVMLAVILVLVVGTIRLVGSNANNVFSSVASSVHYNFRSPGQQVAPRPQRKGRRPMNCILSRTRCFGTYGIF